MRRRKAFFTIDGIAGMIVMSALLIVLAVAAGQRNKAVGRLADTRAASRLAEKTLLDLQQGLKIAPSSDVKITPLPQVEGGATQWIQVEATVSGRTVTLIGPTRRTP
jgi:hypothetical protein